MKIVNGRDRFFLHGGLTFLWNGRREEEKKNVLVSSSIASRSKE